MENNNTLEIKKKYITNLKLEGAFPDSVIDLIELHTFDKNEYICHAGENVDFFHIIVEGRCKVIPSSESGKEVLIGYLEPLSFSGDIELFNECEALHSVQASGKVLAIAISRKVFFNEMMQLPSFLQLLCRSFAEKIYISSRLHSSNMLYPLKNRLSRILLTVSAEQKSDIINIKMRELAQLLGISQRHLRRVLRTYEDDGILKREESKIIIYDKKELTQQSSYL